MNNKYKIYREGQDYLELDPEESLAMRGKREKRQIMLSDGRFALLKIRDRSNKSEDCSEKIAHEIAKLLGYNSASVELAETSKGEKAALSVLFANPAQNITLIEAGDVMRIGKREDYNIQDVLCFLFEQGEMLVDEFMKLMVFDALIGEQDRHWQNWGFLLKDGTKQFAPFYDNADSLMSEFLNNDERLLRFDKDGSSPQLIAYINKSRMSLYNKSNNSKIKSFDMIRYLRDKYKNKLLKEGSRLEIINEENISNIVQRIPDHLLTETHKNFIIKYILTRANLITEIIYE